MLALDFKIERERDRKGWCWEGEGGRMLKSVSWNWPDVSQGTGTWPICDVTNNYEIHMKLINNDTGTKRKNNLIIWI